MSPIQPFNIRKRTGIADPNLRQLMTNLTMKHERGLPLIITPSLAVRAGKQSLRNFGFQPIQCLGLVS